MFHVVSYQVINVEEWIGLNHGAIYMEVWYYIVYVVSLYSIMDVIKDDEELGLNHGEI